MDTTNKMTIDMNTDDLSEQQKRLLKSINMMLVHTMTTDEEDEYFDGSSELLRLVASAIKKANFSNKETEIAYDQQALEYCVDILSDQVYGDDLVKYDN